MSIGANIKKRRFELRMSQQELADELGYKTRSTIAKIESGENDVSHKKLQKFAEVLDTSVEQLISGCTLAPRNMEVAATSDDRGNKNIAVILAGGKTSRNRQSIPNQFINVQGKPILVYCMDAYQNHPAIDDIYIVCLKGWENIVTAYAKQYGIAKLKGIIQGGNSGIISLENAHSFIKEIYNEDDLIVVQESTRPMVTGETISKLLQACSEKGSATIYYPMNEYVQFNLSSGTAEYVDRNSIIALQSPEAHSVSLLNDIFAKAKATGHPLTESCFTMLLYNLGYNINFIESAVNNIKITREEDFATFNAMLKE